MNFKKIFKSKLFYIALLFTVNLAVIITLSVVVIGDINAGTTYTVPSVEENFVPVSANRYIVKQQTLFSSTSFSSKVVEDSDLYQNIVLENTTLIAGQEISKDDVIGKDSGGDVIATYDAICLNVMDDGTNKTISLYNYNRLTVEVNVTAYEYYNYDFSNDSEIQYYINGSYFDVQFNGVFFDEYESNNIITISYKLKDMFMLINNSSIGTIALVERNYTNALCIDAFHFGGDVSSKLFYMIENDKIYAVYIDLIIIIDEYAIITSLDHDIKAGDYLYEF